MYRPLGFIAMIFLVLAVIMFFVAGANIQVSDFTATREIAWGLFCGFVGVLFWGGGYLYVGRTP
jgi:hypothetical protein